MKLKRCLSMVFAMVMLCSMLPLCAAAEEVIVSVSSFNTSRGTGELTVYTSAYGDSTGTNYWGAEAIVDAEHVVIGLGRGNSEIPEGGFVVSGHDDETDGGNMMKTWVSDNIQVGDYVYFDQRFMQLTVSDEPLEMEPTVFYEVEKTVSSVNMSRGENELVVYNPFFGKTTGTNAYGYEVVVSDGQVIERGGNNSEIPTKGFVVSAHGTMVAWLQSAVIDGMRAEFDKETGVVTFIYDAESLQSSVDAAIEKTVEAFETAKAAFVYADYDKADELFAAIRTKYDAVLTDFENGGEEAAFADACDAVLQDLTTVRNSLCDSYPVQYRGVWVRPSQRTAMDVQTYVKELHDNGINVVCVEGWFENGVIMEVPEDCLFEKHPSFSYDVLQAYIDACHQYGMECHLWMPIMNIGSSIDSGYDRTVVGKKPEWLSLSNEGTPDNPDGFMMIDPANEEAREYLVEFYRYLVTTYDIDCFELDYIRYYAAGDLDFGYTQAAFEGFEEAYGYGVTPTYDTGAAYWEDWKQYRRDCVTEMVKAVREMLDEEAPSMLLSADVAATSDEALNRTYQDYPRWLREGLIDMLHPMAYGDGYGDDIIEAVERGGDTCIVVTGLGVQGESLNAPEMERQAREDNSYGAYGDCYFEAMTYLSDKTYDALKETVYRNRALPPFLDRDASVTTLLDYMQGRIDDVLLPLGGITQAEADTLSDAVAAAKEAVTDGRIETASLNTLHDAVTAVANADAKAVLEADVYRAGRIACVYEHLTVEELLADQEAPSASSVNFSLVTVVAVSAIGGVAVIVLIAVIAAVLLKRRQK